MGSRPPAATPAPRSRAGRRNLRAAALAIAASAGLAGTLGALADLAWWLELFAHFRPQYALLLALSGATLFALGARAVGVAALLLAAVNALPLLHYYFPRPPPAPPGPELRVVLANVHFGNSDHAQLLGYLGEAHPDVAIVLEATPAWREALATLDDLPYQAQSGDVLAASREPLAGLRVVSFGGGYAGAMAFGTRLGDRQITIVGAHANWPLGRERAARRNEQLAMLAELVRRSPGPVLLLGDLNVTAFAPRFARLLDRAGLVDCAAGRGFVPSWPTAFPPLAMRIDHCLHGPGLVPVRVANGPDVGSDHYPLEVVLRPVPATPGPAGGVRTAAARPTSRP